MARARKLFPSYGSALATQFLAALERERVVARFVAAYVAENDRRGILGGDTRNTELAATIGREAMLAMITVARQALPRFFGRRDAAKLTDDESSAIEAFSRELLVAIDRAWHRTGEDARRFRRDLAFYSEFAARQSAAGRGRAQTALAREAPFIGRCALLLDPSMLEKARQAAQRLHGELDRRTQKILARVLRAGSR